MDIKTPALILLTLSLVSCGTVQNTSTAPGSGSSAKVIPQQGETYTLHAAVAQAAMPPEVREAYWRASSRLGYGPSPLSTPDGVASVSDVRKWALAQIDAAKVASRKPITLTDAIPEPMRGFNAPIGDLIQEFRDQRKTQDTREEFNRNMVQGAAAWRIMSCSNPNLENPLLARMTEFWFNHLNVFVGKGGVRPFVGSYAASAIRPNALGKFEGLLLASAKHPAMLNYLDQAQSIADGMQVGAGNRSGLNENYARELMELHTLGVDGGYTQNDVRELARVLTGWGVQPTGAGGFFFNQRLHDHGSKTVMGRNYSSDSVREGEDAIHFLAHHPSTAHRIALRMAQFFVSDNPSPELVKRLSDRFLATDGDIAEVMKTLVNSDEFWKKDQTLFKTPMDYACSVLTATGGVHERKDVEQSLGFLAGAGQPMHGWLTPDGYKSDAATWMAPESLSRRADFALAVGNRSGDPDFVMLWLQANSRQRITKEPVKLQTGLALAAPEFMSK